ncbi:hypothetical protein HNP02_001684 [Mycobacterium sp. AZCC_0083]|nr:hypothetical protein [Mycobacterium sp. AZCC_0083]
MPFAQVNEVGRVAKTLVDQRNQIHSGHLISPSRASASRLAIGRPASHRSG